MAGLINAERREFIEGRRDHVKGSAVIVEVEPIERALIAEQRQVVVERQRRIVPALEQHRCGPALGGGFDLLEHLLDRQRPRFGVAWPAVEGAELAVRDADVGVVRVRVDDEADLLLGMEAEARLLGQRAEIEERGLGQEPESLRPVEPFAGL